MFYVVQEKSFANKQLLLLLSNRKSGTYSLGRNPRGRVNGSKKILPCATRKNQSIVLVSSGHPVHGTRRVKTVFFFFLAIKQIKTRAAAFEQTRHLCRARTTGRARDIITHVHCRYPVNFGALNRWIFYLFYILFFVFRVERVVRGRRTRARVSRRSRFRRDVYCVLYR